MRSSCLLAITVILLMLLPVSAETIHVPADQPTIQAGIDAAVNGDTVLVADGTYTGDGNRDIDFLGKAITVRSENGAEHSIIDCEGNEADPHRGAYFHTLEGPTSILEGFTIRDGWVERPDHLGGGILCSASSPTITACVITNCYAEGGGGGIFCSGASPVIAGNTITSNYSDLSPGGGIACRDGGTPLIIENTISDNFNAIGDAGGILVDESSSAVIHGNVITDNRSGAGIASNSATIRITENYIAGNSGGSSGGGIGFGSDEGSPLIAGNVIVDNESDLFGGGIACFGGSPLIVNNLLANNYSQDRGGGIYVRDATPTFINLTITGNGAAILGDGILLAYCPAGVTLTNCILWNNGSTEIHTFYSEPPAITYSVVTGGYPGEGNIDGDPLFTGGPLGDYYLGSTQAGQAADSPCFDAGDTTAGSICYETFTDTICLDRLTTRTDGVPDLGTVDMGWHYEGVTVTSWLVTAPGPAPGNPPLVRLFPPAQDAEHMYQFRAYGAPDYGATVGSGDMNGDGAGDILTGAGPGEIYGPHVRGFAAGGEQLTGLNFLAYGTSKYGVNVAAGDIDGDGYDEIITGAGPGAVFGPHVRGWNYDDTGSITAMTGVSYFAYGTPKWGVNVACRRHRR